MRLLHALVGLLAVAATYALFRQLMPRGWAFLASLLVGFSHAMFMISRLAMRENTAVLLLVVALALLLWGLRENHELATFLGGVVAGLGFYVYYPARVAFPIWVVFLIATGLVYRKKFAPKRLALLGADRRSRSPARRPSRSRTRSRRSRPPTEAARTTRS